MNRLSRRRAALIVRESLISELAKLNQLAQRMAPVVQLGIC